MGVKSAKHSGKSVRERVIYQEGFPVKIGRVHGEYPGLPVLAYHSGFEFHYIKQGTGSYLIGDQNYPFQKNTLVVIRPNEIHCLVLKPGVYLEKDAIQFKSSLLKGERWLTRFSRKFPHLLHVSEKEATMVGFIFNEINEEKQKKEKYWQENILLELRKLLLLLKRAASLQKQSVNRPNPKISRIIAYIEENFTHALTRNSIADKFAISPSHLSHLFTEHAGMNLKHYILQRRILEAKKILTEQPGIKIGLIPQKVGFRNFVPFNRSFKLLTGLTPLAYRTILYQTSR